MSGIYYVSGGREREPKAIAPVAPNPLDLTWFDSFLNLYLEPGIYTSDPAMPTDADSHAEQMQVYRQTYEAELALPWRDGLIYYDPTSIAMHAFYYLQARGNPPDNRWLQFADDAGTFWHLANERRDYGTGTGVYHFPAGLWLCQDYGIALTPEEFRTDCDVAIRNFYGSTWYNNTATNEAANRYSARLMEWMLYMYRVIGHDDPWYKNNDIHHGLRYHNGQQWEEHYFWEWLDEWIEDPRYPRYTGGDFTDQLDYMALSIDPTDPNGLAIWQMGPFMCQFTYQSNKQLYEEDANYQTASRANYLTRMVDFNHEHGWFPASGVPGAIDEYGAWGYFYCQCSSDDGERIQHVRCTNPNTRYWGHLLGPSRELTAFHLEALAWCWRMTGDDKYLTWFDETWAALKGTYERGTYSSWMRNYGNGKQVNQIALRIFNAIVLRGDVSFKCAAYPTGSWPYPTPPQTDPNP